MAIATTNNLKQKQTNKEERKHVVLCSTIYGMGLRINGVEVEKEGEGKKKKRL